MPIVTGVDQSDRAEPVINQGRELADLYGVELHIVHVRDQPPTSGKDVEGQTIIDMVTPQEDSTEIAAEIARRVENGGEIKAVDLSGDPAEELINYSAEHDAEYIVVSGRKRTSVGQALFGSVTQSLLLNANRPIVAVPADLE